MDKKNVQFAVMGAFLAICVLGFVIHGCATVTSTDTGTSSGNYTLSGKVGTVSSSGLKAYAVTDVNCVVAIGANNSKTLVTPESNGTFSVKINSGQPYVLGFFNKTGSAITLLGYLKKSDYDWDSLPIIDPADTATDLGTVEINTTSVEATPSINITSLIDEMNMDASTADLYGKIDDPLTALTNLDLDGNGEFDFNENKNYLFQTFIGMYESGNPDTGEIDSMLDGYNDTYKPVPSFYQMYFSNFGSGDSRSAGTSATLTPPSALGGALTQTATTSALSNGWTLFFPSVMTPILAPSGAYRVAMGSTTYTISNFNSSDIVTINANNNIIYPVFHLVTNESNKITKVQYAWKKLVNGAITTAEAAQVKAAINYDASDTTAATQNPFISFFSGANTLHQPAGGTGLFLLNIDSAEADVSALNIAKSDIHHIQAGYELTSKVICKFDLY